MQGSKLQTENLQSLAQGLLERTQAFQSLVHGRLGDCAETPADVLAAAVELVREAHALLSWLNRYQGWGNKVTLLIPGLLQGLGENNCP